MLIIGKISEENLMFLIMKRNNALNGKLRTSFKLMQMVANMSTDASFLMDGKNKSITLSTIRCMLADRLNNVKNHIARTTTQKTTEDSLSKNFSKYSPKIEVL